LTAASKNEEEVRKLSMEIRYYEQTAEVLQQRVGMLSAAIADLSYASATLENLEKEKENAEMFVPIGGGNYISVKLANTDKIVVGMGSGVNIEKTLPEAKDVIKQRMEELQKTHASAEQQFDQISQRITQDRNRLETLVTGLREGKQ
jgi:prefoldin alpha subunit